MFASHLALKQVHCKHILAGLISIPFLYFTKSLGPISSQYKCRRPQLEIAPGCVVVQTSSEHARPTTIQTLSPLFRSAKTPSRIGQTDESAPDRSPLSSGDSPSPMTQDHISPAGMLSIFSRTKGEIASSQMILPFSSSHYIETAERPESQTGRESEKETLVEARASL